MRRAPWRRLPAAAIAAPASVAGKAASFVEWGAIFAGALAAAAISFVLYSSARRRVVARVALAKFGVAGEARGCSRDVLDAGEPDRQLPGWRLYRRSHASPVERRSFP